MRKGIGVKGELDAIFAGVRKVHEGIVADGTNEFNFIVVVIIVVVASDSGRSYKNRLSHGGLHNFHVVQG